jgi:hypothetical protein
MEMNAVIDGTHTTTYGYVLQADYDARQQNMESLTGIFFMGNAWCMEHYIWVTTA